MAHQLRDYKMQNGFSIMTTSPINSNNLQNSANAVPDNSASQTLNVAREFESIFVSYLMKSMRSTVFDGELMEKGVGEEIYRAS